MEKWRLNGVVADDGQTPIFDSYDVVVCGGGPAGVAAAVTSGRLGQKTLLIEKNGFCGGAAVAGLSATICGMYYGKEDPTTGAEQVVYGFTEEFRQRMEARGGLTEPQVYGKTHVHTHDPIIWREVADDMLLEAGVTCLYHTIISGVVMDGDAVRAVEVESSAGTSLIKAKKFIDATGDAAVIARAGFEFYYGDNGVIQNPTMMFRMANVDMEPFLEYFKGDTICPPEMIKDLTEKNESGEYSLPRNKVWVFPSTHDRVLMMNTTRLAGQDGRVLNVINPVDRTEAEIYGRRSTREYERYFREHVPGCQDAYLFDTGTEVGVRQTRSIKGVKVLTNEHVVECRKCDDGVVRSPWPIELHSASAPKLHWLYNDYYEIPYLTLVPEVGEDIIVAGRNLCAEHEALASARVTAQCFEYGHAAAVAADISIKQDVKFRDIKGEDVRAIMKERGSAL
ncbi:FAD-dependent oxidoreductase [Rhodobacteraceae bacterium RKSG542]|uniref:FAD-dependent oxidoreductase n=1 Tax=Pseudovibrio flavus TaxID=2529854 RepID=UPI0012BC4897|nr:FAD-dependent oxidoreductase [Pseudovibrio flavus]MTI16260.1 FAD-dependent oxidoreductase [Pseudovibrio flavus]